MKRFETGSNLPPLIGLESKPSTKKPEKIISDFVVEKEKAVQRNIVKREIAEKPMTSPESEQSQNKEAIEKIRENFKKLQNAERETIEKKLEHIPTSEEVQSLFEKIVGETKYETARKLEDEQGLYLWEIKIAQEDGSVEYEYVRKGDYKARGLAGGSASETAIHVTYFDSDGIPISGTSVAKFIDNKWVETP